MKAKHHRTVFPLFAALGLVAGATACKDDPVGPPNRSPQAAGSISAVEVAPGDTTTFGVSGYFSDPDGDSLSYEATISDSGVATVFVARSFLSVVGVGDGTATVTVTASDPDSLSAEQSFDVQVFSDPQRAALRKLYEATGGPNWFDNANWLTRAPIETWHGVYLDGQGQVSQLRLGFNGLSGSIPPELAELSSLRLLEFFGNNLTGEIPPELGDLSALFWMDFRGNRLTGAIPPELGKLSGLEALGLGPNSLSGSIPPELGGLSSLRRLELSGNELTGTLPPELGDLSSVESLWLSGNQLSGAIPPELGDLPSLAELELQDNEFSGPIPAGLGDLPSVSLIILSGNQLSGTIPPEFAALSTLRELHLTDNADLAGPLPAALTGLGGLTALLADGTELCAPSDEAIQEWLDGVYKRRILPCGHSESTAYLTQAVQSREYAVPLVANERALLRVFPTAPTATSAGLPRVRATLYVDGVETHVADIAAQSEPIPTELDEGDLSKSVNAKIPGEFVRPGLEMVVEIDPEGELDPELGVTKRIPETGRMKIDVREMPTFELTLIPFLLSSNPDSTIVDTIGSMAESPMEHELLWDLRNLLPVENLAVTAHDPVLISSNNAFDLLDETVAIWVLEGKKGYYQGLMSGPVSGAAGVAYVPGRTSFSIPDAGVMAHELGHNVSLYHAPCGGAGGPDPSFPEPDGTIGSWGYDFRGDALVSPTTPDIMSYCGPHWVSDFYFTNSLRFLLSDHNRPGDRTASLPVRTILLWGGTDAQGNPFLHPSFVVDAPPALPARGGEYEVTGRSAAGDELFSLSFDMAKMADGEGRSGFAFALPVRPEWAGALASLTLSGPRGSVTLDGESERVAVLLLDPRTGQVRGILRDLPLSVMDPGAAEALAFEPGLEALVSRGVPRPEDWRR